MNLNDITGGTIVRADQASGYEPCIWVLKDNHIYLVTPRPDGKFMVGDGGEVDQLYNKQGEWCGKPCTYCIPSTIPNITTYKDRSTDLNESE